MKRTFFYALIACTAALSACKKTNPPENPCGTEKLEKGIMLNNTGMSCCGYMFESLETGQSYEINNMDQYPQLKESSKEVYIAYKQSKRDVSCCIMGNDIIEITCYSLEDNTIKSD